MSGERTWNEGPPARLQPGEGGKYTVSILNHQKSTRMPPFCFWNDLFVFPLLYHIIKGQFFSIVVGQPKVTVCDELRMRLNN